MASIAVTHDVEHLAQPVSPVTLSGSSPLCPRYNTDRSLALLTME